MKKLKKIRKAQITIGEYFKLKPMFQNAVISAFICICRLRKKKGAKHIFHGLITLLCNIFNKKENIIKIIITLLFHSIVFFNNRCHSN